MITKSQYEKAMLIVEEYIQQLKKVDIEWKENPFLDTPILSIGFSVRAHNCLKKIGVNYGKDIIQYSRKDLFCKRHFGLKTMKEIELILKDNGLFFKKE